MRLPGEGLRAWNERCNRALARRELAQMPDAQFIKESLPWYWHYPMHEWRALWQNEYDRRFLLRPAMPGPDREDAATLLRPLGGG